MNASISVAAFNEYREQASLFGVQSLKIVSANSWVLPYANDDFLVENEKVLMRQGIFAGDWHQIERTKVL